MRPPGEFQGAYHVVGLAPDHGVRTDEGRDDELLVKLLGAPDLAVPRLQRLAVDCLAHVDPPLLFPSTAYGAGRNCQPSPASRKGPGPPCPPGWGGPACRPGRAGPGGR